jgi:adenylosuccinate lyase
VNRDEAYRIVQEAATAAWNRGQDFRSVLEADERLSVVPASVLDDAFDLTRSLDGIDRVFVALESLHV